MAALARRSDAWGLGQRQSQLNGSLHRTVGDGLHGLKAIRAAGAEAWLLQRFASESKHFRQVLRLTVRRQSLFTALRDILVVAVVGLWLLLGRAGLTVAAITTTLLLAQRAAGSLGMVISSRRLCLGALPGYGGLHQLRQRLGEPGAPLTAGGWRGEEPLQAVEWVMDEERLALDQGQLVVVAGPSGTGKTTLLDGFCGQLVVYVLRDPADVAVSLSHFWGWDLERTVAFLLDPQACMVRSRKRAGSQVRQSLGRWDQHLTSWCDQRLLPVLPLRYEDLLADPEHQFRRLATFLNLAAGPEALALALEETRFEALRAKEEAAGGFVENSPHQERFFRSGRSGEGRERLSADQLAQLQAAFAPTLAAYGYATDPSLSTPLAS